MIKILPRWSGLRNYGNSFAMRAMIVAPLIGYLLLLNEEVVKLAEIDPRFNFFSTEKPWKMLFLYYGSLLTGLAAIIYQTKCPAIVKKYDSAVEYVKAEIEFHSVEENYYYFRDRAKERVEKIPGWLRRKHEVQFIIDWETKPDLSQYPDRDYMMRLMTEWWHLENYDRPNARVAFFVLGVIGAILLAVPSALTLWAVSTLLLSDIAI